MGNQPGHTARPRTQDSCSKTMSILQSSLRSRHVIKHFSLLELRPQKAVCKMSPFGYYVSCLTENNCQFSQFSEMTSSSLFMNLQKYNYNLENQKTFKFSEPVPQSTILRNHLQQSEWLSSKSLQIINAGEDVEKREPSYIVGADIKWYNCYRK